MTFKTLDDVSDLHGKTALVRVDFNVPVEDGRITDDTRLKVALPTIRKLTEKAAKVADRFYLMDHGQMIAEFPVSDLPQQMDMLHSELGV